MGSIMFIIKAFSDYYRMLAFFQELFQGGEHLLLCKFSVVFRQNFRGQVLGDCFRGAPCG